MVKISIIRTVVSCALALHVSSFIGRINQKNSQLFPYYSALLWLQCHGGDGTRNEDDDDGFRRRKMTNIQRDCALPELENIATSCIE